MLKEGQVRIPSGCAISGIIDRTGTATINGRQIVDSIAVMHDRSNGLGGGFAGYGIYPDYPNQYAFHIFYDDFAARQETETYLDRYFNIVDLGMIQTRKNDNIVGEPLIWRYFVDPMLPKIQEEKGAVDEKKFIVDTVFYINTYIDGAYIFSSGKNMGIFKAVGYPEDVGDFYKLEEYDGYLWTAHGRYPTNTPGWWGGAHPFGLLDYSIVHNGEISSYDANRRFIEMFGYKCNLLTDTEVITYIIDFLNRKQGFNFKTVADIIAAPFWEEIDTMTEDEAQRYKVLRNTFASLLITGPFSIICGFDGGLFALNDRLKLRSMVSGEKGDLVYIASEEAAIRVICPEVENIWAPAGGEPIIVTINQEVK